MWNRNVGGILGRNELRHSVVIGFEHERNVNIVHGNQREKTANLVLLLVLSRF